MQPTNPPFQPLIDAHLTGELTHNSRLINEQAVRELIAQNPYWGLRLTACDQVGRDFDVLRAIIVESFGITMADFEGSETSMINPERTATQLHHGLTTLLEAAKAGKTIALATGHPGSMMETYRWVGELITAAGGKMWTIETHYKAPHGHYLDQIGGVTTLSDEGSLMHSHDSDGLEELLSAAPPDMLLADHGYAAAGVNAGIPTVAFYDTDDPALPIAATITPSLIHIPMNDNQTNGLTAQAIRAFWGSTGAN